MKRRLALFFLLCAALSSTAQQHPNQQKGFDPAKLYQFDSIDNINQFNGNLVVTIPIGQKYPVSSALSYAFTLVYNGNPWDWSWNGTTTTLAATPTTRSNAGMGWLMSLGRLIPPEDPSNETHPPDTTYQGAFVYESSDGGDHTFGTKGTTGQTVFAIDDSNLRLTLLANGTQRVEFPDGTYQIFTDRPAGVTSSAPDWRLTGMYDRFGNAMTIAYSNGGNTWTVSDSTGRQHVLTFRTVEPPEVTLEQTVLDSVTVATFGTGSSATYNLSYANVQISRPNGDTSGLNHIPGAPYTMKMLIGVTMPNGESWSMMKDNKPAYDTFGTPAMLRSLRLPTLGRLEWDWLGFDFPESSSLLHINPPDYPPDLGEDPPPPLTHKTAVGVVARRKYDETNALIGTWQYAHQLSSGFPINGINFPGEPCTSTVWDPILVRWVTRFNYSPAVMATFLVEPSDTPGDTACLSGCPMTVTYHSIYAHADGECGGSTQNPHHFTNTEYGLPVDRYVSSGGRYLSVQNGLVTAPNAQTSWGSTIPKTFIMDGLGVPGLLRTRFAAFDEAEETDRHYETSSRTFYGSNVNTGDFTETFNRMYDHARPKLEVSGGAVTTGMNGTTPIIDSHYKATYTAYQPVTAATDSTSPWILTPYTEKCSVQYASFPGTNGEPTQPSACSGMLTGIVAPTTATRETFCFASSTGYLNGHRVFKSPATQSGDDVVTYFQQDHGNTTDEVWLGGDGGGILDNADLCTFPATGGKYRYNYTYSNGSLSEAKTKIGSSWLYTVEQSIDRNTGLVSSSTDGYSGTAGSGFTTTYTYNSVGQLTGEAPADGATTEYRYTIANGTSTHAQVDVIKHPKDKPSSVLTQAGYRFDALGHIIQQLQLMPDGKTTHTDTAYYPRGLKKSTSEQTSGTPQHFTVFTYDALGRLLTLTLPDGKITTTEYPAATSTKQTVKIATAHPVALTDVSTTQTSDAFGRLVAVLDGLGNTTTYAYDVMDHLTGVTMGVQTRTFAYDGRGFLTSETHPESNTITYSNFDAKGHAATRAVASGPTLTFTMDAAERITTIGDATHPTLKSYFYDSATGSDGSTVTAPGRLLKTIRENWLSASDERTVTEYFKYDNRLLLSSKETVVAQGSTATVGFSQPVSHDDLGLPDVITYPTATVTAVPAVPPRSVRDIRVNGMLTEVEGFTKANTHIGYADNGMLTSLTHANGVTDTITVDSNGMMRPALISFVADTCPPPAFTIQAQPSSVPSGVPAAVVVTPTDGATGNTYELFEGQTADPLTSVKMATSSNPRFDLGAMTYTKYFWVRVTSACGKQVNSSVVTIQVTDGTCSAPNVTTQPASPGTVTAGTVVHLSVATSAATPAYQWYANGSPIVGATSASLDYQVSVTTSFYAAVTTCKTTNSNAVTAIVNVTSSCPQPVIATPDTDIWTGQSITITTNTTANQYEWHYGHQGVFSDDFLVPESQGGHSNTITVRPVFNAAYWVYGISGSCRSTKSAVVLINVKDLPGGDLNSDGRTDFVWRNYTTGQTWIADGYSSNVLKAFDGASLMNSDWHINGFGDVDGDYYPDIIWHNDATGANTLWSLAADPSNPYATPDVHELPAITTNGVVDPDWRLVGVGDIDGGNAPRRAELFFRNYRTGGDRVVWLSADDSSIANSIDFDAETDLNWKIVGVMNGDNRTTPAAVIWRNRVTGQNRVWNLTLSGSSITKSVPAAPATDTDQNWQIEGVGDFEQANATQLAWRNQSSGTIRLSTWTGTAWGDSYPAADNTHADAHIQLGGDFNACVIPTVTISNSGSYTICGGSVRLTAAAAPTRGSYTYHWSTGASTSYIDVSASGVYTVTVTSPEGCAASASVKITVAPAATPVITASNGATGQIDITEGETVVLTSSSSKTYSWSNGATTSTISVGTAGTYTVTTTDSNGCSATSAPRQVVVHPRPPAGVTATASVVGGAYRVTVSWINPPGSAYTYLVQRSIDGHTFSPVSNPDTTVAANTTYIYSVTSVSGTLTSLTSPMDLATTMLFTNDPLVSRVTPVSLVHMTELRAAIDSVRHAAGLTSATWTTITSGTTLIAIAHINEMRTRLNEALAVLVTFDPSLGPPAYTDPALQSGMLIRVEHLQQLRERVK